MNAPLSRKPGVKHALNCVVPNGRSVSFLAGLLAILWLAAVSSAMAGVTYSSASTTYSWYDTSAHAHVTWTSGASCSSGYVGAAIDDDITAQLPLGFTFNYGGVDYTQVQIMSNGRLQFNNGFCGYGTQTVGPPPTYAYPYPDANLPRTMRIYGVDLDATPSGAAGACPTATCYVSYATVGTAPNRKFVATWVNVPEWGSTARTGSFNLQVVLYEGTNVFDYQFGVSSHPTGGSAQIGWELKTTDYSVWATPVVPAANSAVRFYIPASVAEFRMDDSAWSGAGSVVNSATGGSNGSPVGAAQTVAGGKLCRGGNMPANTSAATIDAVDTGLDVDTQIGNGGSIAFWYKSNGAWDGRSSQDSQLLDATTVSNRWFYLSKQQGNGRLHFVITDSANNNFEVQTVNNSFPANTWVHIAITWNMSLKAGGSRIQIYLNGALSKSTAIGTTSPLSSSIGTLYLGDNRSSFTANPGTGNSANGVIDEIQIYNYEVTDAIVLRDYNATRTCPSVDHIRLEHDGAGLTCASETVTVTACANSTCTAPHYSDGAVTGNVTWSGTPGGTVPFTIPSGGTGQTTVGVSAATAQTVTLATSGVAPTPAGAGTCLNTSAGSSSCSLVYTLSSGCFDAVEVTKAASTPIYTKLSGAPFSLDVLALPSGSSPSAYTGTVKVALVDPSAASGNCGDSAAGLNNEASYTFTAADNGRKTFNFTYPYAGKNVKVRIRDATANQPGCSADNFAIRPGQLSVSTTTALNPNAPASNRLAAGKDFDLTATPYDAAAVPAPITLGYTGRPDVNTALVVDHVTPVPVAVNSALTWNNPTLPLPGAAAPKGFPQSGNGSVTNLFQYQDVGTITFSANAVSDTSFTAVDQVTGISGGVDHGATGDCVASSSSNAVSSGRYGCTIGSAALGPLGRFYPDHFSVDASFTPGCAGGFTYMDQDALGVVLAVKAQSTSNVTTTRYITPASTYVPVATLDIKLLNAATDLLSRLSQPVMPARNWTAGAYSASDTYRFDARNASPSVMDGAYDSLKFNVTVTDTTDGVKIGLLNGVAVAPAVTSADSATTKMRFGRLWLGNAYGSEKQNLSLAYQMQYWNGQAFVKNTLDSCTALTAANFGLGNYKGSVTSSNLPASAVSMGSYRAGSGSITLAAPNAAGSVDVVAILGSPLNMCPAWAIPPAYPAGAPFVAAYLQGKWCGSAYVKDPSARATFGISGASSKKGVIYLRESF